jgi:NAD(P) transhydrogenase beta subunit
MNTVTTIVQYVLLAAAACFVLGLHLMNHPARARRGNQLSAAGIVAAVTATLVLIADTGAITTTARRHRRGRRPRRGAGPRPTRGDVSSGAAHRVHAHRGANVSAGARR